MSYRCSGDGICAWNSFQPLHDLAYYPIMMKVIDVVSKKENENYAYILNHEFGLYAGRVIGLGMFIFLPMPFPEAGAALCLDHYL
ncbi:MAG: hypothetical protein M9926_16050 [Lentimicrobium sp.]|uniref:hypothetical protein n=1 Tax=Lentimicrobium sp. TaxID=2034841 RepID=UPI0025F83E68|nr:hypothetical protein [Lentimicrobium sp.]MCO5258259.1 hypothetical protein [Lentimicrobium sp.]